MSYRGAAMCIISTAQHARPKVSGQIEPLRPQFKISSRRATVQSAQFDCFLKFSRHSNFNNESETKNCIKVIKTYHPKAEPGNLSGCSFSTTAIVFWSRFCWLLTAEIPTVFKRWELFLLKNEPDEIIAFRIIFPVGLSVITNKRIVNNSS